ncbi:hypothetical protein ACHAXS_000362 [Conticribra weissflogii]
MFWAQGLWDGGLNPFNKVSMWRLVCTILEILIVEDWDVQGLGQSSIVKLWGRVSCCIKSSKGGHGCVSTITEYDDQG